MKPFSLRQLTDYGWLGMLLCGFVAACSPEPRFCKTINDCSACQVCVLGSCEVDPDCLVCPRPCPTVGLSECQDGQSRVCTKLSESCNTWSAWSACIAGFCKDPQTCQEGCQNDCSKKDLTECKQGQVRVCHEVEPNCLRWGDPVACPTNVCKDTQSCAGCTSINECNASGESVCESGKIKTCSSGTDGCLHWGSATDCPNKYCLNGTTCESCTNACTLWEQICNQGKQKTCESYHNYTRWSGELACESGFCATNGKECGCKFSGDCLVDEFCNASYRCEKVNKCTGRCGTLPGGEVCGNCPDPSKQECLASTSTCVPICTSGCGTRQCGVDPNCPLKYCGTDPQGKCPTGKYCDTADYACKDCTAACGIRACGTLSNGCKCGANNGSCPNATDVCSTAGKCETANTNCLGDACPSNTCSCTDFPTCLAGGGATYCSKTCTGVSECGPNSCCEAIQGGARYCFAKPYCPGTGPADSACPIKAVDGTQVNYDGQPCATDLACLGSYQPTSATCQTVADCEKSIMPEWNPECHNGKCFFSFCAAKCGTNRACPAKHTDQDVSGTCYCIPAQDG